MSQASWGRRYAELDLPVFRIAAGGKVPLQDTHGHLDATTDPDQIEAWWPEGSRLNIGIAVPPGLIVVDVDGPEALRALVSTDRELPATARQRTPRVGGMHLLYRLPEGTPGRQNNAGDLAAGVDTRCHPKGYIVVAPSVRRDGIYRWEVPPVESNIAEAPPWLITWCQEGTTDSQRDWSALAGKVVTEDDGSQARNQTLASVAGLLFRRLDAELAYDLSVLWAKSRCEPAMSDSEIRRTLNSIAGRELRRREEQAA